MALLPRHRAPYLVIAPPTSSLRGTKQSIAAVVRRHGLPRRCAPRNDGFGGAPHNDAAASLRPRPVIEPPTSSLSPPPRHCEERSNPSAVVQRHGLPRRCAPRNDGFGGAPRNDGISRAPRNDAAASLRSRPFIEPPPRHCEERSNPLAVLRRHGLPRRCAPRNDGISRAPLNDAAASLRPYLVIAPLPCH
jgi:hypothetical protein